MLNACGAPQSHTPQFHDTGNPERLSEWNVLRVENGALLPNDQVTPYDLNTPLFTDYAHKFRTIWMPEGVSASYRETETFTFPVGTIISKTFYYPAEQNSDLQVIRTDRTDDNFTGPGLNLEAVKLIETRLLVRRDQGWVALPYVWNEGETEAVLKRTGAIKKLELVGEKGDVEPFPYVVPNTNQCAGCHATNATTRDLLPIGPKARQLNRSYRNNVEAPNQLAHMVEIGFLSGAPKNPPQLAQWDDPAQNLNARARAYLDINCAHCHNKVGPADTSGLHFEPETAIGPHLGICKTSIAAGAGTGGRAYDIVPGKPDQSILTFRLDSKDPGIMMPELGRSTIHREGVELLENWIEQMPGSCI